VLDCLCNSKLIISFASSILSIHSHKIVRAVSGLSTLISMADIFSLSFKLLKVSKRWSKFFITIPLLELEGAEAPCC